MVNTPAAESTLKDLSENENPLWYKDGIIYQVHIKAFRDSNSDGIGDFNGLNEKLDYIKNLGVNIIWLLPFYPSPMKDDGYDISDYFDINPDYGDISDFKKFLKEAHIMGLKVITELVLNHTSDQHELFQKARRSKPGSPSRNMYVWTDTPDKYPDARIIFSDFETSNWSWDPIAKSYYWHRFYSHQPDLNFDNPEVHKFLFKVVDFWFDLGVDGLRLDAVPYLYEREGTSCENLPETHEFLKKLSKDVNEKYKNRMLLAEANQWPEDAVAYFGNGDECQMAFNFPLMPRMYMAIQMEDRFPIIDILEQTPDIPDNCQWAMFLRNHDELTLEMVTDEERDYMYRFFAKDNHARINLGIRRRLAPLVENNRRKIELLNILLFSFPGTPIIYYGDEIGMGDNFYLGDRNGVRTPMQWSSDKNAGFSEANPQKLYLPIIIDPEYHYEAVNVEVQQRNSSSLLWWMRKALNIRKRYSVFGRGKIEFLSPSNPKVIAFLRTLNEETVLVVANLSRFSQVVELDLSRFKGCTPVEIFSLNQFPAVGDYYYMLTLASYDYYWFLLKRIEASEGKENTKIIPKLNNKDEVYDEKFLLEYIKQSKWFNKPADKIDSLEIYDEIPLSTLSNEIILIIKINYVDDQPELYFLPISITSSGKALVNENAGEIIAGFTDNQNNPMEIIDGVCDNTFQQEFFKSVTAKRLLKGNRGEIYFYKGKGLKKLFNNEVEILNSRLLQQDDKNINIAYNDKLVLKLYRKLYEGLNPGPEILSFLSNKTSYQNIYQYTGEITYVRPYSEAVSLGLIKKYIPPQGDAWTYFLNAAKNFLENMHLNRSQHKTQLITLPNLFSDFSQSKESDYNLVDKVFLEMAGLLGERTAQLHLALSSDYQDKAFAPEPYSTFYQRSLYQSLRSTIKNSFRSIRNFLPLLNSIIQEEFRTAADFEREVLAYISQILKMKINAKRIRIHGDYHLKQIIFTGKDFIVTNFEGAPGIPLTERRIKRSPFRDVASLIWSLHYTAFSAAVSEETQSAEEALDYEEYTRHWWIYTANKFLSSYFKVVKDSDFLPKNMEENEFLFHFYLTEKILIEINKCLSENSPLSRIPIKGLQYLKKYIESKI